MLASEATFAQMRKAAKHIKDLAVSSSYMQVEHGLNELEACWDGFVHTSDSYEQNFKTKKAIYVEFASALNEYFEYLGEPLPVSLGQQVSQDCGRSSNLE